MEVESGSKQVRYLHLLTEGGQFHWNRKHKREKKKAQQACKGAEQGITLDELQAALKLYARGNRPGSEGLPYEF